MNLNALRACNFMEQGVDFIRHNFDKTGLPDQDFLNYLCQEKVLFLPPKYNFNFIIHRDVAQMIWSDSQIREAKLDPAIVHFVGPVKPWSQLCVHRYRKEWWRFLRQTPLKNYRPKDRNLKNIFFKAYLSITKPVDAMFTLRQKQQVGRLIPSGFKRKIKESLLRK
jgi:lipopolysaccharide biosynthesis glycosyltransferase